MSIKIIPKQEVFICDKCGKEGNKTNKNSPFYYMGSKLTRDMYGRGIDGSLGGGTVVYDLCGDCDILLSEFLKGNK